MKKDYNSMKKQRESYDAKELILRSRFCQVAPMDFYRDLFPLGAFELSATNERTGLCNAIVRFRPEKEEYMKLRASFTSRVPFSDDLQFDQKLSSALDALDRDFGAGKYYTPGEIIIGERYWDRLVHDDLAELEQALGKSFAYIAPIGYFGCKANNTNASWLYAFAIDLDGVGGDQLKDVLHQISKSFIFEPTYLVNSGHGLHLYYFLEEPIAMYSKRLTAITAFKNALGWIIWNGYTSQFKKKDSQGATQMYRVVGSLTKLGPGYPCTAYRVSGKRVSLEQLNRFVEREGQYRKKDRLEFPKSMGLDYWKEHNPDWYRRVILGEKHEQRRKVYFPWLSENMKELVMQNCRDGNRYNGLRLFFANAAFVGVPYQECYDWAVSQLEELDSRTEKKDNNFTLADIDAAAGAYSTPNAKPPKLATIEGVLGCRIVPNKRNGRTQDEHIHKYIRGLRLGEAIPDTRYGSVKYENAGRPKGSKDKVGRARVADSAERVVRAYLLEHPGARTVDIVGGTGLSRQTVCKWLRKIKAEVSGGGEFSAEIES